MEMQRLEIPGESFSTLLDVLRWRATRQPETNAVTFLVDGGSKDCSLTYGELDRQARAIGAALHGAGAAGERALLLYPPGLDFITAFLGCLYAGVVAVPAYPPELARMTRSLARLLSVARDARPRFVLTRRSGLAEEHAFSPAAPGEPPVQWLATDEVDVSQADGWRAPRIEPPSLAFLQYTSGSTSSPRGVMVSHASLLHNVDLIRRRFEVRPDQPGVIWLPPYHDMGLVGGILAAFHSGNALTLMSPLTFLKRPLRWLEVISRTEAVISGGPNFAYDLCIRRVSDQDRARLDLSRWSLAFTGAEPVRAATLDLFAETFKSCGFRREAFFPCYGLAESTLMVSGGRKSEPPVVFSVRRDHLWQHRVTPVDGAGPETARLVGCGRAAPEQEIAIVDPETEQACAPGVVGEIWVAGPSVASGYWNRPEETRRTFGAWLGESGGPYLRTGDLGFVEGGELFVTGRLKDLIICDGRNHHPPDIEQTAEESHPAIRAGHCAAFAVEGEEAERLVIVAEVSRAAWSAAAPRDEGPREPRTGAPVAEIERAIRRAVAEGHDLRVHKVLLLPPGTIYKTSSGKIQRQACRAAFLSGSLPGPVRREDVSAT